MNPTARIAFCLVLLALAGCAGTIGVQQTGPDSFVVSEMRAPVLGGFEAARQAALGEATSFCHYAGREFVPIQMGPSAYASPHYGPMGYTAEFRCLLPADPVVLRLRANHAPGIEPPPPAPPAPVTPPTH
jgi:hypothetical protein